MQTPLILTIDLGTTSTRAMLFDATAKPVPGRVSQVSNRLRTTSDGGAEFAAAHLFDNVVTAIDQLLDGLDDANTQIAAIAMDTFVGNLLGVDESGQPVTPVYTYADTRNARDAQALRAELGETGLAESHDRTGCMLHTSYLPARFRWLQRTRPDLDEQVARWISIGEYVQARLTEMLSVSTSVAAWSGLLNRRGLEWDRAWLERLNIDVERFSPLVDFSDTIDALQPAWKDRWPQLADARFCPAVGDGAAANIGSGCDTPDRIALTIGTTGAMRMVVDPSIQRVPSGLWLYRVDSARGLLGGATTEGGSLFAWLSQTLQLPPAAELEAELLHRAPTAHGLTVLPFIGGERAPGWNEAARGTFSGVSMHTDAVDLVQASLESIAYRFALIHGRIKAHLPADSHQTIIASGGALLQSPAWMQIMADVLGQPVVALEESELTSRGVALLALEALGEIENPSDLSPATGKIFEPDAIRHSVHQEALVRQVDLYERLYA